MDFLKQTLPIFLFLILILASLISSKSYYITIPIFVISVWISYSLIHTILMLIMVLWLAFIIGNHKVVGYKEGSFKLPKCLGAALALISISFALIVLLFFIQSNIKFFEKIFIIAAISIGGYDILRQLTQYCICPLFIKSKKQHNEPLVDYYTISKGKTEYCVIQFGTEKYIVDLLTFKKFKNKIGVIYSYEECKCLLNVIYIRSLKFNKHQSGKSSNNFNNSNAKIWVLSVSYALISGILLIMVINIFASSN